MISQRTPQIIHRQYQSPGLSLGIPGSTGGRRPKLGVVKRVLSDIRDELLRGE